MNLETIRENTTWWPQLIKNLNLPSKSIDSVLELQVVKKNGKLFANTPEGRREVFFSTISCQTGIGYMDNNGVIHFFPIPNLPWEEITRNGSPDKRSWTWGLEES